MRLAMDDWRTLGKWRRPLSAVAIGALLGLTGPFGTQTAFSPAVKYSFWMVLALVGFAAAATAERLLPTAAPGRSAGMRMVAIAAASALPMTFFVAWAFGVVQQGRTFTPLQLLGLYPFVALVQLLIARVIAPDGRAPVEVAESQAGEPQYPSDFLSKLPIEMRRDILALEAEDHYLRVHTLHGSALILMRLADAAARIDPRLGLRIHRSWWVAKDGVRALETASGRGTAWLVDGAAVPISRAHLPAARAALADQPYRTDAGLLSP